jgi:intein/homing endonuclease
VDNLINVKTQYGFEVRATEEHPYFIYSHLKKEGLFKRLKDVNIGDFLGIVKPVGKKPLLGSLDLKNYINTEDSNVIIDEEFITNKFSYSPKNKKWSLSEICKKYNVSKSIAECAREHLNFGVLKKSQDVLNLCENLKKDGYIKPEPIKIHRNIKFDNEFLYLIGWYLAEGSCENGARLEFSLNIDELNVAFELKRITEKVFGIKDVVVRKMRTKCCVRVSNKFIAQFFKNSCGQGALNKKIPSFLIGSEKKLMPLVKGYIEGDGCLKFDRNHVSFTTISPSLAFQMQSILNSNGVFLSCKKQNKRASGKHDFYQCTIPNHYIQKYMDLVKYDFELRRNLTRKHKPNIIENETHFFVKIKEIAKIKNTTEVYDLCVEDSHSFVGNGLVCHNTVTEAMATKTMVICPQNTSLAEITNYGDNSISFLYNQANVFVNDFEKIRFTTNPHEVTNLLGIAYNLRYDEEEVRLVSEQKIERAYEKVKSLKWDKVAKLFKDKIDKLAK